MAGKQKLVELKIGKKAKTAKIKKPEPFRFLEHTADIMIEANGKDYPSALKNIALGMFSVLGKSRPKESFDVDEQAANHEELVVYLLSTILAECDARELVPCKSEVLQYDQSAPRVKMRVWGERKPARDHIKAVTFHELMAVEDDKTRMWTVRVLFDV